MTKTKTLGAGWSKYYAIIADRESAALKTKQRESQYSVAWRTMLWHSLVQ